MRTCDDKKLEALYESELTSGYDTEIDNEIESEEVNHNQWETYKESLLNLEDEIAELDFDTDPVGCVEVMDQLTAMLVAYNKTGIFKPNSTSEYIDNLPQANVEGN